MRAALPRFLREENRGGGIVRFKSDEWSDQAYGECQACTARKDGTQELCEHQRSAGNAQSDRGTD